MRFAGFALLGAATGVLKSEIGFSWITAFAIYAFAIGMLLIVEATVKGLLK